MKLRRFFYFGERKHLKMIEAVLNNKDHPEYGETTITFPIPRDEYGRCIGLAEALEIGSTFDQDCQVFEILGPWPVLKRLEDTQVNFDELDYLAKRLDSFDARETAQFQAMAEKLDLCNITDLINLTFCCQKATVITDFSNLEAVGRSHFNRLPTEEKWLLLRRPLPEGGRQA